jgi:A/G-specific adenine glycosylase
MGRSEDKDIPLRLRRSIRRRLLNWYDKNRRDLPWRRRGRDPYAQWVAEIMLQQTRVETVLAYYEGFLRRFPTVDALAKVSFQQMLKHWEGLGYYRRALHLHRAAREIQSRNGAFPDTVEGLRELPGIGEYTASAIASIAYKRPAAAVDGNVARVLSRIFRIPADTRNGDAKRTVQRLAQALIPVDRPGDFNQAWMDLGSSICTPRAPQCPRCPLEKVCEAAKLGEVGLLPRRRATKMVPLVVVVVGLFQRNGRWLVRRRATGGLWSGLWEFPNEEVASSSQAPSTVRELARKLNVGLIERPFRVATVRHDLTHRSIRFEVYVCEVATDDPPIFPLTKGAARGVRWVDRRGFEKLAVSTAHRRIFTAALSDKPPVAHE